MQRNWLSLVICVVAAGFIMAACSKNQPLGIESSSDSSDEISLEKELGGFTTSNEEPMFGDDEVIEISEEDVDVSDQVTSNALIDVESDDDNLKSYLVRIKWGMLEGDEDAADITDWSGTASINRGTLALLKTIRFEPHQDAILLPRPSPKEIAFQSFTTTHFDGLLLLILDLDTTDVQGELTINAGSYSRTFLYSELDSLDLIEPVDSPGNEVSIISHPRATKPFSGGFLAGRWVKTNNDPDGGRFWGRWINTEGIMIGSVRGIWGTQRNGSQVFFGKYIGLGGEFGGLLRGHWEYTRDRHAGVFEGRWIDRTLQEQGRVKGHFKTGRDASPRGFFHGRWAKAED